MQQLRLALLALLWSTVVFDVCQSQSADSQGIDFVTMFIRNYHADSVNLTLTFINPDTSNSAMVNISGQYYNRGRMESYDNSVTVLNGTFETVQVPSAFAFSIITEGQASQPNQRIRMRSSIPISVIATSLDPSLGTIDRFIVHPITALGTIYSFALDETGEPTGNQFNIVYVIPVDDDVSVAMTVMVSGLVDTVTQDYVLKMPASTVDLYYYSTNFAVSGHLIARGGPVAVVVGSSSRRVSLTNYDHRVYMPLPVSTCQSVADQHASTANDPSSTTRFFVSGPPFCTTTISYLVSGSTNATINNTFNPNDLTPSLNTSELGSPIAFQSNTAVQVVRALGAHSSTLGASLTIVPSTNQYVTGTTLFVAFNSSDSFEVIGDETTMNNSMFNSISIPSTSYSPTPLPGYFSYRGNTSTSAPSLNQFSSSGQYSLYVYGGSIAGTYSYLAAYNVGPIAASTESTVEPMQSTIALTEPTAATTAKSAPGIVVGKLTIAAGIFLYSSRFLIA